MANEALKEMKKQADDMGIKYSPNIGVDKLQDKINKAIIKKAKAPTPKKAGATKEERQTRKRKEAFELVRVKVSCYDPTMKGKSGTYIMASNSLIGTVRKFIQFNKPWLMPRILVNVMEESKYQAWVDGKSQFGITQKLSAIENRYTVTRLAQLTPQELENISKRQAVTSSLED